MPDKTLTCVDCQREFVWMEREQEFFAEKQFQPPKRCFNCRKAKRERQNSGVK